jgi:CheY-like chemotaxis protein/anti-sigma regulatory factor (Ser/Thr protein kinase)
VALDTLVAAVVQDFRSAAPQHELLLEKPATPVFVEGDRARLEQVVVNLLANAIKYSPQGGTVDVRVSTSHAEARVRVADQGIGIPAEEQGRLFQRFFRAQNAGTRNFGGLGIGLFVSHQIVERHGGRFEVESSTGKGASFTFYLPLAEDCLRPRGRILLVDDDPAILEATSELLREWSYCVDEAPDGAAALELARGVPPDLVLVDLQMPKMDGPTLIRRLREEKIAASAPIVIFTAGRDAMGKAAQLGADAVLRKPFEIEELQEVVARLLLRAP